MWALEYVWKNITNKKHRLRTVLSIGGVTMAMFLLGLMLFLVESAKMSVIHQITQDVNSYDFRVYKPYSLGNSSDFMKSDELDSYLENKPEFNNWCGRYVGWQPNINESLGNYLITGIDLAKESSMGISRYIIDRNLTYEGQFTLSTLPTDRFYCIVTQDFLFSSNLSVGDEISIDFWIYSSSIAYYYRQVNLTIYGFIVETEGKYPVPGGLVVDIYQILDQFSGDFSVLPINEYYIWLSHPELLYDLTDFDTTERRTKALAYDLQKIVGFEWQVEPSKLYSLEAADLANTILSVVLFLISLITFSISGALIYGIINTSIQERVREFGILRAVGAQRKFLIQTSFIQAALLFSISIAVGMGGAWMVAKYVVIHFLNLGAGPMDEPIFQLVVTPTVIFVPSIFGLVFSLLVSYIPAIKVARTEIIESLNPYRYSKVDVQTRSMTKKLLAFGVFLSFYGVAIFLYLPFIILSLDLIALVVFVVLLLLSLFIGFTLIVMGFRPIFQRLSLFLINRFKRLAFIVQTNLERYKGRSQTTGMLIGFSFAFIIFVGSIFAIANAHIQTSIYYSNGSDLVLLSGNTMNSNDFMQDSLENSNQVPQMLSWLSRSDLQKVGSIEGVARVSGVPISSQSLLPKADTAMTDYASLLPTNVALLGIDSNYLDTVYTEYIELEGETSIRAIFDNLTHGHYCIIAKSLAEQFKLEIGDPVQLQIESEVQYVEEDYKIIGIAARMPGFEGVFSSLQLMASGGGVMISLENYVGLVQISEPVFLEKIFVKIDDSYFDRTSEVIARVNAALESKIFVIHDSRAEALAFEEEMVFASIIMEAMGWVAILLTVFSLVSSTSSIYIERTREIAIMRVLGLYNREVNRLFYLEILILLVAAGLSGSCSGYLIAWLLYSQINLFIQIPPITPLPIGTLVRTFLISIIILTIGLKLMFKRFHNKFALVEVLKGE